MRFVEKEISTIKVQLLKDTWNKIRENNVRYKNDSQSIWSTSLPISKPSFYHQLVFM